MKEGRIFTVIFISVIIGVALFMASEIVRLNAEVERLFRDEKETVLATEHSDADSESEEESETASLGDFKITYYCPCNECSGIYGNQTSTGVFAEAVGDVHRARAGDGFVELPFLLGLRNDEDVVQMIFLHQLAALLHHPHAV